MAMESDERDAGNLEGLSRVAATLLKPSTVRLLSRAVWVT